MWAKLSFVLPPAPGRGFESLFTCIRYEEAGTGAAVVEMLVPPWPSWERTDRSGLVSLLKHNHIVPSVPEARRFGAGPACLVRWGTQSAGTEHLDTSGVDSWRSLVVTSRPVVGIFSG